MLKLPVILEYDPLPKKGKPDKMFKPWWMIGVTSCDVAEYYSWFLRKRTGIVLMQPAWGAHISVVRGEVPERQDLWKKYHGATVTANIDPDIKTNGKHWWLRVECEDMKDIREELGLYRHGALRYESGHIGIHLTIGNPAPTYLEISEYYHRHFTQI